MSDRIIIKTNGEIDLTIPKDFEEFDNNFDIYLHGTDKLIGRIWFDEGINSEFTKYFGNVGYSIDEKYRGNNYALKALKLIKEIMLDNDIKNMIFSISPSNIASRKTVEKFGARIVCHRPIPQLHKLYNMKEKEVIIYKCYIGEDNNEENKSWKHI